MKIDRRLQRGVTVLELMLVVVIIAVIGFIATTRFMQAKDRSYVGAAQSELSAVRQVMAMYAADYGTYPAVLGSINDLHAVALDPTHKPYMSLPGNPKFTWLGYSTDPELGYVLRVQAHDHGHTVLLATADGLLVEG